MRCGSGGIKSVYGGVPVIGGLGTAAVYQPEGEAASRWEAGSQLSGMKIDRWVGRRAVATN
jgi:hypothetical protein